MRDLKSLCSSFRPLQERSGREPSDRTVEVIPQDSGNSINDLSVCASDLAVSGLLRIYFLHKTSLLLQSITLYDDKC
jgi:hypothetical protein